MIASPSSTVARSLNPDFDLIEAVAGTGNGVVDMWEASPVRLDSNVPRTGEIIDILFPGNPLLCCGWDRHRFDTRPCNHWYKLDDLQFIVPNPMTARSGLTRSRKPSAHALTNTGPRRFLILEFDFDAGRSAEEARLLTNLLIEGRDERDLCAALLLHLAQMAPLVLAVYSGGKSLHGWFYCDGRPERTLERFMQYAVSLGVDKASWISSQFTRMPDGLRSRSTRQTVYFFNPSVLKSVTESRTVNHFATFASIRKCPVAIPCSDGFAAIKNAA